jgi:uncharacterized protein YegP (UPF0339 family)
MATATKKPQAARKPRVAPTPQTARKPRAVRSTGGARSAPSEFRLFENNAGDYHWLLASKDGTILAQSAPFASLAAAETGAAAVRDGAAAARLERPPSGRGSRMSA